MNASVEMVVKPQFFDDFHCLGGDCKYTCCKGWNIELTKNEYEKTKKAKKSKELQNVVDSCMKRTKECLNDNRYAKMKLDDNECCQLMSEDGLCRLQLECGYNLLSDTCKHFPRVGYLVGNSFERYFYTSCEAVVKLLIARPEGIALVQEDFKVGDTIHASLQITEEQIQNRPALGYYWDIKTLGLGILQCAEIPFVERMMLLGIAMKRLTEFEMAGEYDRIPSFVDHMLHEEIDETVLDALREIKPTYEINTSFMLRLLADYSTKTADYGVVYNRVVKNYGIEAGIDDVPAEKIEESFVRLNKFFEGREYILCNVFVNFYLSGAVPFKLTQRSIWENYMSYCLLYSYAMNVLAGYLDENSTDDDFIYAVAVISRMIVHNTTISESFSDSMKTGETDTLAHMAMFIKH